MAGGVQVVAGGEPVVRAARARELEERELRDVERRPAVRAQVRRRRARRHGVSKYGFGNRALRATRDMFGVRWLNSRRFKIRTKDGD